MHSGHFWFKNVFGRRIRWKPALHSRIFLANTEVMHRPRSDSSLHFDIKNTYQLDDSCGKIKCQRSVFAPVLERWPQVCRVKMTFKLLRTNWFFSTNEFDEMLCKLEFTKCARSFPSRTKLNPAFKISFCSRHHELRGEAWSGHQRSWDIICKCLAQTCLNTEPNASCCI